jgi:cyclic beta-1,2-glucan synthetase
MNANFNNRCEFFRLLIRRIRRDLNVALRQAARQDSAGASSLLENRSALQSKLVECSETLTRQYCRRLVRAEGTSEEATPRIYRIVAAALSPAAGRLTAADLSAALAPERIRVGLTLKELDAIPIVAKLVFLNQIVQSSEERLRSVIESLQSLERIRWRDVIESISLVERQLRLDPNGVYPRMTFESRSLYRRKVQRLARAQRVSEEQIAKTAVEQARNADSDPRRSHVGYHLLTPRRRSIPFAEFGYVTAVAACAALLMFAAWRLCGPFPIWWMALLAIAMVQTSSALVNLAANLLIEPTELPRLDFSKGIPPHCRTVVAIPTLLLSREGVAKLIKQLEIHFLANRDKNLRFVLLTDFADSKSSESPNAGLLTLCSEGVDKLNAQYAPGRCGPFYLFHRRFRWNESEQVWMGRERKRGKLEDFNQFLLGQGDAFETKIGDLDSLGPVRYVITLDTDTQLPRDTAWKLAGTMAHPLNQAVLDPETKVVVDGYAVLQPRVSISMESAGASRLAALYSGDTGIDPYVRAISDVYQDLCGRATYVGKGIYDLHAFHQSLGDRFPANTLLSHDLIEGEHARVGLVTDVEVVEDYPVTYESHAKRKHRWVRGDWQILEWLLPRVPAPSGRIPNPLPLISRWKILDNLRRSLVEFSLLLALTGVAFFAPSASAKMIAAIFMALLLPTYVEFAVGLGMLKKRSWRGEIHERASQFWRGHVEAFLTLTFLLHQSLLMLDAIVRTLVRRFITKKRLLEWESMAQSESGAPGSDRAGLAALYLLACPALGALVAVTAQPSVARVFYVIIALWIASPAIAQFLSARPSSGKPDQPNETEFLRDLALKTWRFFADLSTPQDHWLVPDNIQQAPDNVAHQCSPTNIGLQLASTVAAFDFGYLNHQELASRVGSVLDTLGRMERYKGHFYNWYDTRTLELLRPRYVSTVDSGNLAAALVTLKQSCLQVTHQPIIDVKIIAGLRDCCLRVRNTIPGSLRGMSIMRPISSLLRLLDCRPANLLYWKGVLSDVAATVGDLNPHLNWTCDRLDARDTAAAAELRYWQRVLNERVDAALAGLCSLAPWLASPYEAELRSRAANPQFQSLIAAVSAVPHLDEMPAACDAVEFAVERLLAEPQAAGFAFHDLLISLIGDIQTARAHAAGLLRRFKAQSNTASEWAIQMNFAFLLDRDCDLLRIGYNADTGSLDESCYDLLASEARTAVFFAVAKGDIPREVWFSLGRKITSFRGLRSLLSWSGTMFEYLMPALFMKTFVSTLLYQTMSGVVRIQQAFARDHGIPWGISESACSSRDTGMRYNYRAFGVPAVSLSSGDDTKTPLVVAPYASVLALLVDHRTAILNLRDMASRGWTGRYGFYESIDFRAGGFRTGRAAGVYQPTIVRSFMAHHQGMSLLALCNVLFDNIMQKRFHADPLVASADRLLQERVPLTIEPLEIEPDPADVDSVSLPVDAAATRETQILPV